MAYHSSTSQDISTKPDSTTEAGALSQATAASGPPNETSSAASVPAPLADSSTNDAAVSTASATAASTAKLAFSLTLKTKAASKKALEAAPAVVDEGKPFVMALKAGPVKKEAKSNASNIALWNKKALELHEDDEVVVPTNAAMPKSGQPHKRSQV
jgi:hypothetical protein